MFHELGHALGCILTFKSLRIKRGTVMKQKIIIGCIVLVFGVIALLMLRPSSKTHVVEEEMERISLNEMMDEFLAERGWNVGGNRDEFFIFLSNLLKTLIV